MLFILKELIFNFLCIIMAILLWRFMIDKKIESRIYSKMVLIFPSTISIVLCMLFPITLAQGVIFDLRLIPIGIAGLYGGPIISIILFLVTITYRSIIGGEGAGLSIAMVFLQTIISIYMSRHFFKWQMKKKIISGTFLSSVISITTLCLTILFYNSPIITIAIGTAYVLIHTVCMTTSLYIIESLRASIFMREKLIKMKKMEALYHLAAAFGHEIRQPITVSKGTLQLLTEDTWSREEQKEFLQSAIAELNRSEKIIKDYQIFADPFIEKTESFDLEVEIHKTVKVIQPLAEMNNVEILLDTKSTWIKGEKSKIQQCLVNIYENAIEAMEKGGLMTIQSYSNGTNIFVDISDTGRGMEDRLIKRLGEPFFSLKEGKGTGLGMMVVYRIIEGMDGKVRIQSKVGKGTKVTIILPCYPPE